MQSCMVYELLCVAKVIEYNIGSELQNTSVVQRETEVCVCVLLSRMY
jgi:hypothetical protein